MHFKHIAIRVKNLEQSIGFYEKMTGLAVARRLKADPAELVFLSNGDGATEIELVCIPGSQTFEGKGMFLCFETDQLEAMHRIAETENFNPSPIQDPGDGTKYFYVYDPDGVSVQLRAFPK